MALQKLVFKPGVNRDQTNYANEGGWYECDKIRFLSGFPQKIGGWKKYVLTQIDGVCRQMFNYVTSYSDNLMFMGTNSRVYIEAGGVIHDITPLRQIFTAPITDNCFTTVAAGSGVVTVNIPNHGATTGDGVAFIGVQDFDGLTGSDFSGVHVVNRINDNTFTIVVSGNATSGGVTGGGTSIIAAFQINIGNAVGTTGYGWGVGAWGRSGWSTGAPAPLTQPQRDWFFDNFDNDTVMNIRGGKIYYWTYTRVAGQPNLNAIPIELQYMPEASDAPLLATQVLVAQGQKILMALGTTDYGLDTFNPLLIRWSDIDNPFNFTPSITNSAGFLQLPSGSKIVCGLRTRQEILVWTTSILYSLQFTGTNDVFSVQQLADNMSIISPRAKVTANNTTYWMGLDKFYMYNGTVQTLPTTLRNEVFSNLNFEQVDQIISGTNEGWNEVWWHYPSANSTKNDRYVIYNHVENIWYYGTLNRSSWIDSPLRKYPQATDETGFIYNHEQGCDDDTLPMTSFISSSDVDIQSGDKFTMMRRLIPDFNFTGSTATNPVVNVTVKPRSFPGSAYQQEDLEPVIKTQIDQYTEQVFLRARARQIGFKILSDQLGVNWQSGANRLDGREDGRR